MYVICIYYWYLNCFWIYDKDQQISLRIFHPVDGIIRWRMNSKKIRRKEFHVASSFTHLINVSIYFQALVCSLSALWWLPQHTQRGWGEVSWYLAVSLHWRYNSGVKKFLNKSNIYIKQIKFCWVSSFTLLLSSSHPEHRPRTIFLRWHQLLTLTKDGKQQSWFRWS